MSSQASVTSNTTAEEAQQKGNGGVPSGGGAGVGEGTGVGETTVGVTGFGVKVAAGLPRGAVGKGIVASNLDQIGEVLKHNDSAILVQPGDVNQLAEGILKLAEDEGLRARLGERAREEVIANYTWEKNADRVLTALKM